MKIQDTEAGEVGQWLEHVGSYSQEEKGFPSSCVTVLCLRCELKELGAKFM